MRTLQSRHTVVRPDQFDSEGWQLPEITELCHNNDEGCATNYMSVIAHLYQRPRCMDDDTPAGDHDPASTRSCRPRQKTTSNGNGPARSHPQTVETPRTLHAVRAVRSILRHPVSGTSDVDPHGSIGGHPACIATTGATRDEEQEEQCCEPSGSSVGARQSRTERQLGNTVEEGAERLRSSTDCDPEGGYAAMYYARCEMCGNRWQRILLTMVARDPETTLNNRTVLASTGKRPVEIERPFCPHGHGSMMMQATLQQCLSWECSTCSTTSGFSLDGCGVSLWTRGASRVPTRTWFPLGTTRHSESKKCRGS